MSEDKKADQTLYCSFCGSSQHEVGKLIAGIGVGVGVNVFICDECTYLCFSIVVEDVSLDSKNLREVLAKLPDKIAALVKRQPSAEQNDGGNDGGNQD